VKPRLSSLVALSLLAGCSREGLFESGGVYTTRSACPQVGTLTARRKAGDPSAAIDPLSDPGVRAAVQRATFEHLIGFQLTDAQLRYNATR